MNLEELKFRIRIRNLEEFDGNLENLHNTIIQKQDNLYTFILHLYEIIV